MSVRVMWVLAELSLHVSTAIVAVALLRKVLRRIVGAQLAYWLWLLVPICAAAASLPPPVRSSSGASKGLPQLLAGMLPDAPLRSITDVTADYATLGAGVWISVSLLMLGFMLRRQRAFVDSLGALILAADGTYRSAHAASPLLLGVWRPRIILPANFATLYQPDEQALVLAHEQAHRRRGDTITNAIAAFCLCFSWFNPLMYWAIGRIRFDQELACDAQVLAHSGRGRRDYAQALLKTQLVADSAWHVPIRCYWQSSHPLEERIVMLKCPLPGLARRLFGAVLMCTLMAGCSYTLWAAQPERANSGVQQSQVKVAAEQMSISTNGAINSSGNVVVSGGESRTLRAATLNQLADGAVEALGPVQIAFKDTTITADRALVRRDGTIEMEQATIEVRRARSK